MELIISKVYISLEVIHKMVILVDILLELVDIQLVGPQTQKLILFIQAIRAIKANLGI
jgi:hypothetical protein